MIPCDPGLREYKDQPIESKWVESPGTDPGVLTNHAMLSPVHSIQYKLCTATLVENSLPEHPITENFLTLQNAIIFYHMIIFWGVHTH